MKHPSGEELSLHYYGEARQGAAIEEHLRACTRCAGAYADLARALDSITAPSAPEASAEFPLEIWQYVRARLAEDNPRQRSSAIDQGVLGGGRLAALAWLVPILYPFSFAAIFRGAQIARTHTAIGIPVVLLALMWALAGPFVALFVLKNNRADAISGVPYRLALYGALVATISPALYNLTARIATGLPMWYLVTALAAVASVLPLSESRMRTEQVRRLHRFSALLIGIFVAAHLSNHVVAIVSVSAHTAVMETLRIVYRQRLIEIALIGSLVLQLGTGATLVWHAHLRRPSKGIGLQALSGLYLAVFILAHVSAVLLARPGENTNFVWAAGQAGLLANPRAAASLPYYLLGVAAVFVHIAYPLHLRALAYLSDLSVRRLSYAAMGCGGLVVLALALALCGIHLIP